jgi:hypothetical protein
MFSEEPSMARHTEPEQHPSKAKTGAIKHDPPAGKQEPPTSVQPIEPEDPRQTGSSKPAQRELLEQNVRDGQAREHPETVAGQHATGSFTDKKRRTG